MNIFCVRRRSADCPEGREVYRDVDKSRCLKKAAILASKEFPSYSSNIWKKDDHLLIWNYKCEMLVFEVLLAARVDEAE